MTLYEQIVAVYPELADKNEVFMYGEILLQNDSDGFGDYIAKWDYSKPLPEGMKVGKN